MCATSTAQCVPCFLLLSSLRRLFAAPPQAAQVICQYAMQHCARLRTLELHDADGKTVASMLLHARHTLQHVKLDDWLLSKPEVLSALGSCPGLRNFRWPPHSDVAGFGLRLLAHA